ncbi:polysaccharide pyruvyl transferase family protein [Sutcliffiella rhizosphaerae]|uniref:Polysaccharide pyruvyl transferase domain-containing protein n=1 Tax=Sutcliffiella rhizosphaerae TaxID=2880967 RepID=A0ABM8YLA9_9BACI|nr:polysaccharide pyruvyl transferase family protein [Sutcliffiella rhizosphaerae]CAG9620744.1 hypothetical protein BACCIP111883_01514 [Sutcliffiella rhizosphaerae]
MKKVFVDIYLQFNLGDDLFLDILAKRFPNTRFTLNYLGTNYDEFILSYANVNRRKYTFIDKVGQKLKLSDKITNYDQVAEEHDALLFIGGSIFREEDYHPALYKDRVKIVKAFKEKKRSVFVLGANFGPFTSQKFLNEYKAFFALCDDVCFRDYYSVNLFRGLNNIRYAPDIVFQLDTTEYDPIKTTDKVGISIIDVRHKRGLANYYFDYVNSTVLAIEKFTNEGNECCLMSFCEAEGDTTVMKEVYEMLSEKAKKKTSIFEYKGELKQAIRQIASMKMIIAARFHANILGFVLGKGVLPVIYNEKTTNVLKDLEIEDISITFKKIDDQHRNDDLLKSAYSNFPKNLDTIKKESVKHFEELEYLLEPSLKRNSIKVV